MKQSHSKERTKIKSLSPQKESNKEVIKNQGPVAKVLTKDAEEQMREYLIQNDPGKSINYFNFQRMHFRF